MKEDNFSEWYNSIIKKAELADLRYGVKGFIIIMPNAVYIINNIYKLFEEELEKNGHKSVIFPIVIPEKNLSIEKEHVKGFENEVFWITHAGHNELEEKLVLRPTSETAFYPMYRLWINGSSDLPLKLYQSGKVWRYETKATKPFIRGREFLWIETHCAFSSKEEAIKQVKEDMKIASSILKEKLGIPFLLLKRPVWDKFAGADETYAFDTIMPDGKVLQIATTHLLGENFSRAFGITFMDENNNYSYVNQTCFGPGISRIFAALISIHGDDKGLILPTSVVRYKYVIIPIYKSNTKEEVLAYARNIYKKLKNAIIDESEHTPGYKFNEYELKGIPIRIEIGINEVKNKTLTIKTRLGEKVTIKENELEKLKEIEKSFDEKLKQRSSAYFSKHISKANTWDELKKELKKGPVKVPFCSIEKEGEACYKKIKTELNAEVRGVAIDEHEKPEGRCIVCGKKASVYVYIAKQY